MKRPGLVGMIAGATLALTLILTGGVAGADHGNTNFYQWNGQWDLADTPDIDAGSMQNIFDGSATKRRKTGRDITHGESQWNAASDFDFGIYLGMNGSITQQLPCDVPLHRVRVFTDYAGVMTNPNALAGFFECHDNNMVANSDFRSGAIYVINTGSNSTFFKIGGGQVASHRYDFRSIITHELGHATGWVGHWGEAPWGNEWIALCGEDPIFAARQTMCPSINPGEFWMRSTESHDESAIDWWYDQQ